MIHQMKQLKIFAVLAVLLLCANLFVWFGLQTHSTDEDATTTYVVTEFSLADLSAVLVANEQMTLGVLQQNGELQVIADDDGAFDSTELLSMMYLLCNMTADKQYTDPDTFASYGFDAPTAQVALILADGTEYDYQLLNQNSMDGSYYLYDVQNDCVYLIGEVLGNMLNSGYSYYYQKTVFPVVDTSNYLNIEQISLDFGENDANDYTVTQKNGTFYLTAPIEHQISAVQLLSQLVSYVSALYAEEVVATNADLSEYGFDDADLVLTMTMAGTTYQGAMLAQDDGSILLADTATGNIYLVYDGNYNMLSSDYVNLLAGKCFSIATGDLSRLQFELGADVLTVDVTGLEASVELRINGMVLEQEAMVEFVDAINSIYLANAVQVPSTSNPTLTMTATASNGAQSIYSFIANQTGGYDVSINGVTNFAATSESVQILLDLVNSYL